MRILYFSVCQKGGERQTAQRRAIQKMPPCKQQLSQELGRAASTGKEDPFKATLARIMSKHAEASPQAATQPEMHKYNEDQFKRCPPATSSSAKNSDEQPARAKRTHLKQLWQEYCQSMPKHLPKQRLNQKCANKTKTKTSSKDVPLQAAARPRTRTSSQHMQT